MSFANLINLSKVANLGYSCESLVCLVIDEFEIHRKNLCL